jgi:hypothetical protein
MQEAVPGPIAFPLHQTRAKTPDAVRETHAGLGRVLQSVFTTFAGHPVQILLCAFVCFAGAAIIGALLYSTLTLNAFFHNGSYFAAAPSIFNLQMQIQAAAGAFTFLLGRGAITWIAIQSESGASVTVRTAFRETLRRWKPLLLSSLVYGVLITVGLIGLTWMLRELRLDASNFRWIRSDANSIMNMAIVRSIGQLTPDPGSPFSELYAVTRYNLSRQSSSYYGWSTYQLALSRLPVQLAIAGVAGLLLMFVTETLLCMRTAVIMRSPDGNALGWFGETLRLSWRNFWTVAAWRWGVRLALIALYIACLTLPTALHQSVIVPALVREVRSYWPYPANTALTGIGVALIGMIITSFNLIFEARMCAILTAERH